MTNYTIQINHVPADVPTDVIIEHIAVALRKMQKGRKALKRIDVQVVETRSARSHPFDGPEVNDDEPSYTINAPHDSITVFSGKREDDWADTPLVGQVALVPEHREVVEVEVDLDDVVNQVYKAIGEDFPYLAELFRAKSEDREVKRSTSITDPVPEGEWDLDDGSNVGDEL